MVPHLNENALKAMAAADLYHRFERFLMDTPGGSAVTWSKFSVEDCNCLCRLKVTSMSGASD